MYEISLNKSSLIFQSDKLPFSHAIFAKLWSLMVKKITVVGENLHEHRDLLSLMKTKI